MKCLKFPAKDCDLLTCHTKRRCLWHDEFADNPKEPETVHGNEAEKEVINDFISAIEKEFSDQNWEYLHFIAERVLQNRKERFTPSAAS